MCKSDWTVVQRHKTVKICCQCLTGSAKGTRKNILKNWLDSEVLVQGIKYIIGYNFPLIILLLGNRKKEPTEGVQETEQHIRVKICYQGMPAALAKCSRTHSAQNLPSFYVQGFEARCCILSLLVLLSLVIDMNVRVLGCKSAFAHCLTGKTLLAQ